MFYSPQRFLADVQMVYTLYLLDSSPSNIFKTRNKMTGYVTYKPNGLSPLRDAATYLVKGHSRCNSNLNPGLLSTFIFQEPFKI